MKRSIGHRKILNLSAREAGQFDAFVSGLLLGDAQISKTGSLRIGQSVKRIGWLRQVKARLAEFGCDARISNEYTSKVSVGPHNVIRSGPSRMLTTRVYEELKAQRKRWYRDRKIVPRDLCLSAEGISHWFVGDGNGDTFGLLRFCTNGFTAREVDLLIRLLPVQARSVLAGGSETQRIIKVCKMDEAVKLANLVRPFLPRCAMYKIKHVRPAVGRWAKAA
jgi:LAGLIDADG DNA endonuclease family